MLVVWRELEFFVYSQREVTKRSVVSFILDSWSNNRTLLLFSTNSESSKQAQTLECWEEEGVNVWYIFPLTSQPSLCYLKIITFTEVPPLPYISSFFLINFLVIATDRVDIWYRHFYSWQYHFKITLEPPHTVSDDWSSLQVSMIVTWHHKKKYVRLAQKGNFNKFSILDEMHYSSNATDIVNILVTSHIYQFNYILIIVISEILTSIITLWA